MSAYQYMVVVHGMGESRYGQTILPVISRCAEVIGDVLPKPETAASTPPTKKVKDKRPDKEGRDIVTLGAFVGASPLDKSDRPWVEFEGIRSDYAEENSFTGVTTHDEEGNLLRFVDLWWKDLVDKNVDVLEPASPWADGLIGRIKRLGAKSPNWMPQLLFKLQDVLGPVQSVLKMRVPDIEDLGFNKYLGDVQIYAEYKPMRGIAVQRFHERMEAVYEAHYVEVARKAGVIDENAGFEAIRALTTDQFAALPKPHFTIIAHSLGSIMSLDALMYAHRNRSAQDDTPNFPFAGYDDAQTGTAWIINVSLFVTLGSPIDKFLLFWPYRYDYLNETDWIDQDLVDHQAYDYGPHIQHINYCDEQDPVGQSLDTLRSTKAYQTLFSAGCHDTGDDYGSPGAIGKWVRGMQKSIADFMKNRGIEAEAHDNNEYDVVYRRSVWPGLAHTSYWKDNALFKNILEHTLIGKRGTRKAPNVVQDKSGMYILITILTYFIIPLVLITVATVAYDSLLEPTLWKGYFMLAGAFVFMGWIIREVVNLLVWWRQLLRNKRSREVVKQTATSIFVKWAVRLGMPLLAFGFAQTTLDISRNYVQEVKTHIDPTGAQAVEDKNMLEFFYEPFQLLSGTTTNTTAFWVCLLGLLGALIFYRTKVSNFKESSHYESYLSIPVDIIVFITGYWLLLTMWQEQPDKNIFTGGMWESSVGLASLIALLIWHAFKVVKNLITDEKEFMQIFQEIVTSSIVAIGGWLLISSLTLFVSDTLPQYMEPDTLKRTVFFCYIAFIVWMYMSLRFFVAKMQLGSDKVPEFAKYYRNVEEVTTATVDVKSQQGQPA